MFEQEKRAQIIAMRQTCHVVPPHLLSVLAQHEDIEVSRVATRTLEHVKSRHAHRKRFLNDKGAENSQGKNHSPAQTHRTIVQDHLLEHLASSEHVDEQTRLSAQATISLKASDARKGPQASVTVTPTGDPALVDRNATQYQGVYDMKNQDDGNRTYSLLPGALVRAQSQPPIDDPHANEAYENIQTVLDFYREVFDYHSVNDRNMPIVSSVHFLREYQNAEWTSDQKQMVFGDGGKYLYNFTACLDVIAHELTHAVTDFTCMLKYEGESGALNEHLSDAFGIMARHWANKTLATDSDWRLGEGCLVPGVTGVSLRNMKFPGTAYDNPQLGKDPQPASVEGITAYKAAHKDWAEDDNGGVHIFSGIPNRAFALAAEAFQGFSWDKAGKIWWKTVRSNHLPQDCTFMQFAGGTILAAKELFDGDAERIVRHAWEAVGVKASG